MAKLINESVADLEKQVRDLEARLRILEEQATPKRSRKLIAGLSDSLMVGRTKKGMSK